MLGVYVLRFGFLVVFRVAFVFALVTCFGGLIVVCWCFGVVCCNSVGVSGYFDVGCIAVIVGWFLLVVCFVGFA